MKQKYYAVTTSMTFEKTVLVPVDSVEDIDKAIDLVECAVEDVSISLLTEDAYFETKKAAWADENGMHELSDDDAALYQILK